MHDTYTYTYMLVNALEAWIYLCWSSPGKIYPFWASGGSAVWHLPGSIWTHLVCILWTGSKLHKNKPGADRGSMGLRSTSDLYFLLRR